MIAVLTVLRQKTTAVIPIIPHPLSCSFCRSCVDDFASAVCVCVCVCVCVTCRFMLSQEKHTGCQWFADSSSPPGSRVYLFNNPVDQRSTSMCACEWEWREKTWGEGPAVQIQRNKDESSLDERDEKQWVSFLRSHIHSCWRQWVSFTNRHVLMCAEASHAKSSHSF